MDRSEILVVLACAVCVVFVFWYFLPRRSRRMDEAARSGTVELKVAGMTCPNCVRHVTSALTSVDGVLEARVDLEGGTATVRIEPGSVDAGALAAAVNDAGYEAGVLEG